MNAHHLYSQLEADEQSLLKIFFYVAADQDHPIHNSFKQRSCHIKLMIVDGESLSPWSGDEGVYADESRPESVAIQGSGNQDTQSWFHSQEVNVMIDSPVVCKAWREGIERNQNTAAYGRAQLDGCWYDAKGKLAAGSYGNDAGKFAWAKGIVGTVQKAKGV